MAASEGTSTRKWRHAPVCPRATTSHRLLNAIAGDWSLNGMVTLQSGAPLDYWRRHLERVLGASVTCPSRLRARQDDRGRNEERARSGPPERVLRSHRLRQLGRPLGQHGPEHSPGPVQRQFDFALAKAMRATERVNAELRWEIFKAFNQATFSNPNSSRLSFRSSAN